MVIIVSLLVINFRSRAPSPASAPSLVSDSGSSGQEMRCKAERRNATMKLFINSHLYSFNSFVTSKRCCRARCLSSARSRKQRHLAAPAKQPSRKSLNLFQYRWFVVFLSTALKDLASEGERAHNYSPSAIDNKQHSHTHTQTYMMMNSAHRMRGPLYLFSILGANFLLFVATAFASVRARSRLHANKRITSRSP